MDYAHCEDFLPMYVGCGGKRWTTQEIVEECLNVIQQFRSYEGDKNDINTDQMVSA